MVYVYMRTLLVTLNSEHDARSGKAVGEAHNFFKSEFIFRGAYKFNIEADTCLLRSMFGGVR